MKCKNEDLRKFYKCGVWNGDEWECWTELKSLRQCYVFIVDPESRKKFEEETETHGYKDNIDDISRQIDDDRKIRARKNVYALKGWIGDDVSDDDIDDILEFLEDMRLLNDDGKMLRKEFWKKYIKK